jgi:hypothetical protein
MEDTLPFSLASRVESRITIGMAKSPNSKGRLCFPWLITLLTRRNPHIGITNPITVNSRSTKCTTDTGGGLELRAMEGNPSVAELFTHTIM